MKPEIFDEIADKNETKASEYILNCPVHNKYITPLQKHIHKLQSNGLSLIAEISFDFIFNILFKINFLISFIIPETSTTKQVMKVSKIKSIIIVYISLIFFSLFY